MLKKNYKTLDLYRLIKENQIKRQNKKNDKSNKKSVYPGANRDNNLTIYLKNLSQLFGALFWCDSSAYSLLRS